MKKIVVRKTGAIRLAGAATTLHGDPA